MYIFCTKSLIYKFNKGYLKEQINHDDTTTDEYEKILWELFPYEEKQEITEKDKKETFKYIDFLTKEE